MHVVGPENAGTGEAEALGITFSEHIAHLQKKFPGSTGEFSALMHAIMVAGKVISSKVRRTGLIVEMGSTGKVNVQGEEVQYLDETANQILIQTLGHSGCVCIMGSEENAEVIPVPSQFPIGNYALVFDPLDGSSNIDASVSTGTIFAAYRRKTKDGPGSEADLLQPGTEIAAAGYVLYGSSTILVYAARDCGVYGFTLDPSVGEFLLSHPSIQMPVDGTIFSVNEGNRDEWTPAVRSLVDAFKGSENPRRKPYTGRYIGSLVADFHRNLLYGGLFLYPPTLARPHGKLRLLPEAAPLAFLCEHAGGGAYGADRPILAITPEELHQRVPLYIGSQREIDFARQVLGLDPSATGRR